MHQDQSGNRMNVTWHEWRTYETVHVSISVRVSVSFLTVSAGPNLFDSVSSQEPSSWQTSHFLRLCGCYIPLNMKLTSKYFAALTVWLSGLEFCEARGRTVVMGSRRRERKKAGSYLWKAGWNNSRLAQETVHTSLPFEWNQVSSPRSVEGEQESRIMSSSWLNMSTEERRGHSANSSCRAEVWLCQSTGLTSVADCPCEPCWPQITTVSVYTCAFMHV